MKLWKEECRNNAQELIDWIFTNRRSGGWVYDRVNRIAFAELAASASKNITIPTTLKILDIMIDANNHTIDHFEIIYEDLKKEKSIINTGNNEWKFFIPLGVKLDRTLNMPARFFLLGE